MPTASRGGVLPGLNSQPRCSLLVLEAGAAGLPHSSHALLLSAVLLQSTCLQVRTTYQGARALPAARAMVVIWDHHVVPHKGEKKKDTGPFLLGVPGVCVYYLPQCCGYVTPSVNFAEFANKKNPPTPWHPRRDDCPFRGSLRNRDSDTKSIDARGFRSATRKGPASKVGSLKVGGGGLWTAAAAMWARS